MDALCWALVSGYVPMAAAVAVLYRDYRKCQEARLKEVREHEKTLEELHKFMSQKRGGSA